MKTVSSFASALIVFVVLGCATGPVKVSESTPVPSERLLPAYFKIGTAQNETAKIIIVRDSGFLGSGLKAKILVNGDGIGTLWPSERIEFYLPLGEHMLGVVPEPQLGGALQENSFLFREPKTYYFRFSVSASEGASLQPSTQLQ